MTEIFGYVGILLAGVSLGLIGGGGSILVVPIFVYLFALPPAVSTAYSLFVVGCASLIGALRYARTRDVDYQIAALFAVPGLLGVYFSRHYIVPALPETLLTFAHFTLTKNMLIMTVFAGVMLLAGRAMILRGKAVAAIVVSKEPVASVQSRRPDLRSILPKAFGVGLLTGFVGAGGGFLIIPALVIFAKLPMRRAVGTSLAIITVNSLIGFLGDASTKNAMNWTLLLSVASIAGAGILIGTSLSHKIPGKKLEPAFGWFVLIIASYILLRQFT